VKKDKRPSVSTIGALVRRFLRDHADPRRAASSQRFFKEPVACYGVDAPTLRRHARELAKRVQPFWNVRDALALCDDLIRDAQLETKSVGLLLLAHWADDLRPADLPLLVRWIERYSGNWAIVDLLAPTLLGPLVDNHPEVIPGIVAWTESSNLWLRRSAIVAFLKHARAGRRLPVVYRIARRLLGDEEDLIHKATGWVLREAGKADRERLTAFLLRHGPRIPRTTVRYALEQHDPVERRRLMAATKGTVVAGAAKSPRTRPRRRRTSSRSGAA
jgi:3-methyladenine DNA glycosylase AlkD